MDGGGEEGEERWKRGGGAVSKARIKREVAKL